MLRFATLLALLPAFFIACSGPDPFYDLSEQDWKPNTSNEDGGVFGGKKRDGGAPSDASLLGDAAVSDASFLGDAAVSDASFLGDAAVSDAHFGSDAALADGSTGSDSATGD